MEKIRSTDCTTQTRVDSMSGRTNKTCFQFLSSTYVAGAGYRYQ